MELKYHSDDKLILKDDTRELSFLDLAKINGYQLEDNPNHHWVLYHCKELIKDKKIEFGFGTTYYTNGNLSQLYFGYFLNDINRRTIELNEDGTVKRDFIIIFNPQYVNDSNYYYATVSQTIQLEEYLCEDTKYFESYDKSEKIKSSILDAQLIKEYMYYSERYCNLFNHYSDNYEILKNIIQRLDDEWYLETLERNIKNNNGFIKQLYK